jgi:hypothetical protein
VTTLLQTRSFYDLQKGERRQGWQGAMEESSPRGTGPNANEEAALPGVPKLSPSSAPLTSLNARGVGTWPGWYESSSAASKSLDPSGQTKDTFEAQAGASTSYRPLYDSSATPLAPSSSHTLSLLGQSFESPRPVHTGALSSSLSPRQPLSYPKTVFSSRSQSGLSSYAEDVSSRSASGLAHETEFSSRAGIKPKGTEFSVRSPPPVPTFAMGGSTTDSLVVRDAKGLELQRGKALQLSPVVLHHTAARHQTNVGALQQTNGPRRGNRRTSNSMNCSKKGRVEYLPKTGSVSLAKEGTCHAENCPWWYRQKVTSY